MGWTRYYEVTMDDGLAIFHAESSKPYEEGRLMVMLREKYDFIGIPDDKTGVYYDISRTHIRYIKLYRTDYDDGMYYGD